jgi:peptidoglycan lytic transglycosylase
MRPVRLLFVLAFALACDATNGEPGSPTRADAGPAFQDPALKAAIAVDPTLRSANDAIATGHPWRATVLLAPDLRDPKRRSPAHTLLAARAAAGWNGWSEVERLLATEAWVDSLYSGEAAELLARAALERGDDGAALSRAAEAVRVAPGGKTRAERQTLLARALDRAKSPDSAAPAYASAAAGLPSIADWLLLRAAGSERDAGARARIYRRIRAPVARSRVAWTEAQARERFGDYPGAAERFAALGSTVQSMRLRLAVAQDSASRARIRAALIALIRARNGTPDARLAADVVDAAFKVLSPAEELTVARSAAVSGPPQRAIVGFERALSEPAIVLPADRLLYAQVLARAGRRNDAMTALAAVAGPLAGPALYQRARIQLTSGSPLSARATLRNVAARFAGDASSAAPALYLLADLATDDGKAAQARETFRTLYRAYPTSALADDARFRAALIAFAAGNPRAAAVELDSLVALYPSAPEAAPARYWSGRAWAAAGKKSAATDRWRAVLAQQQGSYYGFLSARRLGVKSWAPPARAGGVPRMHAVDDAIARAALLRRLGMDAEVRFELDALERDAPASKERMLATAYAFLADEQLSRAIRLGTRLVGEGERDASVYRLIYPVVDQEEIARAARAKALDPALVAALIRQESEFNPHALSVAGARGLMQLLPAVGEEIARGLGYPVWNASLLFDADVNLQLGVMHLSAFARRYGTVPMMLAAYNAGGARVARWSAKTGAADPELFAEQIPFVETRDYVRIVQRNAVMYRALYPWKLTNPARAGSPTPSSSAAAGTDARRTPP